MPDTGPRQAAPTAPHDPESVAGSRRYLALMVLAGLVGAPVCAVSLGFLALVGKLQPLIYTDLPESLGFHRTPPWWPLPMLAVAGSLVALTIRYLPGTGGHEPADGLSVRGTATPAELPGILLAAVTTLSLGGVLGPEAPLIALGGGVAAGIPHLVRKRPLPPRANSLLGAAGSFAAVSTLLGSPLTGAFLLMEVSGLGGPMLEVVLLPGLLAAGLGSLIFIGLGSWTGLGTYSLALRDIPTATPPTVEEFGWAVVIGLTAALVGAGIRRLALRLRAHVQRRRPATTVALGLATAALAIAYQQGTGKAPSDVLYSGQNALGPLLVDRATYSGGVLLLLVACKGLAYCACLSGFRGGPIFPAMYIGAAGGIALSQVPGVETTSAFAMGIGAMSASMLGLPLTSVLLATLLLGRQGLTVMPLVIVSVVVAHTASLRLSPGRTPAAPVPPAPGPQAGNPPG